MSPRPESGARGATSTSAVVLEADGVAKAFGSAVVLDGATFAAEAGRVTALMGRNGTGKTTLFRVLVGAVAADRGTARFRGEPVRPGGLARAALRGLFYVPQGQVLARGYTVRQHLDALARRFGSDRVEEAVGAMQLEQLLDHDTRSLSGGERMRASLALALARDPVCLVIDEPLARLAPLDQERLSAALRGLADRGAAVVTSGHDARTLLEITDRVVWCVGGATHTLGTTAAALEHEGFVRDYLGERR